MRMDAPQQNFGVAEQPEIQTTTVKAYVVAGDTRSSAEAEAKINSRRTLGN
jgi:hypothetical protein